MNHQMSSTAEMQRCIEACRQCYEICFQMATTHCLEKGGQHAEATHLRLMLNCAEICQTAASFMLSRSPFHQRVCAICIEVCEACAQSCEEVGEMDECVEACRQCAQSCSEMTGTLQQSPHEAIHASNHLSPGINI